MSDGAGHRDKPAGVPGHSDCHADPSADAESTAQRLAELEHALAGAEDDSRRARAFASLVRKVLAAATAQPGAADAHSSAWPWSRALGGEEPWQESTGVLSRGDALTLIELALPEPEIVAGPVFVDGRRAPGAPALVAAVAPPTGEASAIGHLVVAFSSARAARRASQATADLAAEIALAALSVRRTADRGLARLLSASLAHSHLYDALPPELMQSVNQHLRSHGMKLYLVRRDERGPLLQRIHRPGSERRYPLETGRGLADWVVLNNDWLLIPRAVPAGRTGEDPEVGLSSGGRRVEILARDTEDIEPDDPIGNRERTILAVPLRVQDRAVGALSVCRTTDTPFSCGLDLASLEVCAGELLAACWAIVRSGFGRRKAKALSELSDALHHGKSPTEVYNALAHGAADVARATRAVVYLQDPDRPVLFPGGHWEGPTGERGDTWGPALHRSVDGLAAVDVVRAAFEQQDQGTLEESAGLTLRFPRPVRANGDTLGVVAVLDANRPPLHLSTLDDDIAPLATDELLASAGQLLTSLPHVLSQAVKARLSDALRSLGVDDGEQRRIVLREAARVLLEQTACDGVVVYGVTERGWKPLCSAPDVDVSAVNLGTLTERVIQEGQPRRILDVTDRSDPACGEVDIQRLASLAAAFGWRRLRSWLAVPVGAPGRTVGVIKLLTRAGGAFLGPAHEATAKAVAEAAAWQMGQRNRRLMLAAVNKAADALADKEGPGLATAMGEQLAGIADRFLPPGCGLVIVANLRARLPRVFASSRELTEDGRSGFEAITCRVATGRSERQNVQGKQAVVVPLRLPGASRLRGHLAVVGESQISDEDAHVAVETAREMAIILDHELRRLEWVRMTGRFRHALIGPALGVLSGGRMLAWLASRAGADPGSVTRQRAKIEREAESIRLWRDNQRLYLADSVSVTKRSASLREVVQRVKDRWETILSLRANKLVVDYAKPGDIVFPFDVEAVDIALSNLLDNARKYTFEGRPVRVRLDTTREHAVVSVEDEGHPLPKGLEERIFEEGVRLALPDPLRAIDGSGLGLAMVKGLVEAHEGRVYASSLRLTEPPGIHGITPHKVTITIRLPHRWKGTR